MCVPNFSCPFCCHEKFQTISSLKEHILSLVNDTICTICDEKFTKISDFVLHLNKDCVKIHAMSTDLNDENAVESNSPDYDIEISLINQRRAVSMGVETENSVEVEAIETDASNNHEDSNLDDNEYISIDENILVRALLPENIKIEENSPDVVTSNAFEEDTIENAEPDAETTQYYCQLCNMTLNSIEEHLENFHAGQEVLVQPDCLDELTSPEIEVTQVMENDCDDTQLTDENSIYIIGEPSSLILPNNIQLSDLKTRINTPFREFAETISEEDCVDKDGRVYTRKVVKIGQFWNGDKDKNKDKDKDKNKDKDKTKIKNREPIIEKFIIDDNGKPQKLTEEEERAIEDKDSIITLHVCPICHLQYSELQNFHSHNCNMNAAKRYICSECDAEFYGPRALCAHMKLHSKSRSKQQQEDKGPKIFNCDYCGTQFSTFKSLRLHVRMHQPIREREIDAPVTYNSNGSTPAGKVREKFLCPFCNKTFDKQYESVHMNSHNGKTMNYDCNICNRKLYTQANLDMHMKAHSNTKKFACSYCKKPFVTFSALTEHLTQQCQKRQYECKFCGRRFARPHEKVKHERIHTGEKPHNCEVCGKSFRVSYCLTLHMRTHSGMRPYHCETCGKRFKSHSVYNHHLLTHSKERNYKCPFCPKAFKTSVQLAGHKNSHIKPFTCTECNRPFASLYAVRTHMETHKRNNNLKFDCAFCGASYARTFALRDHMREQHQTEMDKLPIDILQGDGEDDEGMSAAASILVTPGDDILMDIDGATESTSQIGPIAAIAQ